MPQVAASFSAAPVMGGCPLGCTLPWRWCVYSSMQRSRESDSASRSWAAHGTLPWRRCDRVCMFGHASKSEHRTCSANRGPASGHSSIRADVISFSLSLHSIACVCVQRESRLTDARLLACSQPFQLMAHADSCIASVLVRVLGAWRCQGMVVGS